MFSVMSVFASMVLHAVGLLCLLSLASSISATPIPLPLPLMAADYSLSLISVNRTTRRISPRRLQSLPIVLSSFSKEHGRTKRQLGDLGALTELYDSANLNANDLKDLAASSAYVDDDDYDFQKQYVTSLTGFNDNISSFQTALADAAASDKGLANYDRQNNVETLLKKVVNANKDVLSATTTVVYNVPTIGPMLGPIVYSLKCVVDDLLDATEDITDAAINALGPSLRVLLGQATQAVCKSGAEVIGLCV